MGEVVCLSSYREQKLREEVDELAEYVDWLLEGIDMTPQPYYPEMDWSEICIKEPLGYGDSLRPKSPVGLVQEKRVLFLMPTI